jgi:hypothetical protein
MAIEYCIYSLVIYSNCLILCGVWWGVLCGVWWGVWWGVHYGVVRCVVWYVVCVSQWIAHLLGLFCWPSKSCLRYRKPSLWAVCEGGKSCAGLWAGAERERRFSSSSLGRGLLRGLGRSRARGRSYVTGAERLLVGRYVSPLAWNRQERGVIFRNPACVA